MIRQPHFQDAVTRAVRINGASARDRLCCGQAISVVILGA
jgi:hypothetical protein